MREQAGVTDILTFPFILSLSTEAAFIRMLRMLFYSKNYSWMQIYLKQEI